ncbi:hypothetical protein ACXM2N_11540 (plasmid) [Corynebacterium sp. ZY180755]
MEIFLECAAVVLTALIGGVLVDPKRTVDSWKEILKREQEE